MSYSGYWQPAQVTAPGQAVQAQPLPGVSMQAGGMPQLQQPGASVIPLLSMYLQQQRMKGGGGSGGPSMLSQAGDWINQHLFGGPSPGNSAAPLGAVQQEALPPLAMQSMPDLATQSVLANALTMGAVPMVPGA